MKTVGIDKDNISLDEAQKLKKQILNEQNCQIILYETKRGYHLVLIFDKELSKNESFKIRKKYGDCEERFALSKLRSKMPDVPIDILFAFKRSNGSVHWRRRVW